MITRRGLLAGMLAACAAPAFVRAESLMILPAPRKVWTGGFDLGTGDYTVEGFYFDGKINDLRITKGVSRYVDPNWEDGIWNHVALVGGSCFVNGELQPYPDQQAMSALDEIAKIARPYLDSSAC